MSRITESKGTYIFSFDVYSKIIIQKDWIDLHAQQLWIVPLFLFFVVLWVKHGISFVSNLQFSDYQ